MTQLVDAQYSHYDRETTEIDEKEGTHELAGGDAGEQARGEREMGGGRREGTNLHRRNPTPKKELEQSVSQEKYLLRMPRPQGRAPSGGHTAH